MASEGLALGHFRPSNSFDCKPLHSCIGTECNPEQQCTQECNHGESHMKCVAKHCHQHCNNGCSKCTLKCHDSNQQCKQECNHGECEMECHEQSCHQQCNNGSSKCSLGCHDSNQHLIAHDSNQCQQTCFADDNKCTSTAAKMKKTTLVRALRTASVRYHTCRHYCTGEWSNCSSFLPSSIAYTLPKCSQTKPK